MRLSSTLQRELVELPGEGRIGMYVCGPTVYQRAHIGNARPYVVGAWVARWLRAQGREVTLVHNITDVNDKIYDAAPGASAQRAADATEWYLEDVGRFGLDAVDHFPKVTETMDEIIAFVAELVERDYAYEVEGDVYFRVARWPEYGRLSGQRPDQMEHEDENPRKEDPRDFALWKANKPGEDTSWDSPWGKGRPGWHIECSAMSELHLGTEFEVHGGGLDLVFPHHENELAQSRALGHRFARIWMHNGMLRFGGAEMHKSLGNIVTLQDALATWGRETLLLFFATGHWRKPLDFTDAALASAEARAERLREVFRNPSQPAPPDAWDRFQAALDDDFSTPAALALMHEWRDHDLLRRALEVFGLGALAEEERAPSELHDLARGRQEARAAKDFARADELRVEIEAAGWEVRDDPGGYRLVPRR